MKQILIATMMTVLTVSVGMAQGNRPGQEGMEDRIEAQRVAFITQRLRLTSEEAQVFWPLYNEYQDKLKGIKDQLPARPEIMRMSDDEAESYLKRTLDTEQRELDLKKEYIGKMRDILPVQKVAMLGHVERAFNRELLKRIQEGRRNNQ